MTEPVDRSRKGSELTPQTTAVSTTELRHLKDISLKGPQEGQEVDSVEPSIEIEKQQGMGAAAPLTDFPEGGFGWLVVLGAFVIQFCCFGFNFSWGVYSEYYFAEKIFQEATLTQLSWVGGIGASSVFLTGPFQASMTGRFGLRPVIAVGTLICGAGVILASFATSLWHLYLTQGVLFGLGAGMALFTSIAIPVQWFDKRRGLASGITVAGAGTGGATLAPLNRYLISTYGHRWALRIMGISIIIVIFSILYCIRARIKPTRRPTLFDLSLFKDYGFSTLYSMAILATFGYLTPVFLFPNYVASLGMDIKTGATLVGVFSGVNAAARVVLGLAADRWGAYNILIICTFCGGLSCIVLWLNAKGLAMCVVFMVVYGINGGGFVSLFPVVAARVMGVERLTLAVGLLYSGNLFGNLLGTPTASAIVTASGGSYTWAIVFAGITPILGSVLLTIHRFKLEKRVFVKV